MDYMSHLYGRNKKKIIENSKNRIYKYDGLENGKFVITEYEIFKGVRVFYNDIHTSKITSSIPKDSLMKDDMKSIIAEKEGLNAY